MLEQNIQKVLETIEAHKTVDKVTLVAVTKFVDIFQTNEVVRLGVKNIGENKAQTLKDKLPYLIGEPVIHFIGHLQRNKVKEIIESVDLIHSVDSVRLAKEIDLRAGEIGKKQAILVQVNIAKEESKFGFFEEELEEAMKEISQLENIEIHGFMMMAPLEENPEDTRIYFKKMKELFDSYKQSDYNKEYMNTLSMGMSNDYMIALEEGSNMVRVGTALYSKEEE
ncbi:YggS family pyridoxal phosphate-dependent enzyme [Guggenheimella bovis]